MSKSGPRSRFTHHELITLTLVAPELPKLPARDGFGGSSGISTLDVDVTIETTSSIELPSAVEDAPATPFPPQILDLVRVHRLRRLLVQVGSSSTSSCSSCSSTGRYRAPHLLSSPNTRGPVGTSIIADFYINKTAATSRTDDTATEIEGRAKSLLRSLVGSRLICAPLDSVSIHKNQHHSYPLRQQRSTSNEDGAVATYQIVLPASSGHFCLEGLQMFRRNLLPCRHHAGFLAAFPSSDMMLGMASSSRRGSSRRLWIDVRASGNRCRDAINDEKNCTLLLRQGVSYGTQVGATMTAGIGVGIDDNSDAVEAAAAVRYAASFSLGDVLDDFASSLNHCPLADTSRIVTSLPLTFSSRGVRFSQRYQGENVRSSDKGGYEYELDTNTNGTEEEEGYSHVVHDVHSLTVKNRKISLSKEWIEVETEPVSIDSLLSVHRKIDMPKGIANHGTFYTVYRRGIQDRIDDPAAVFVETMDTYPRFIKPLLQSLSVRLYHGHGAGSSNFVPSKGAVFSDLLQRRIGHNNLAGRGEFVLTPCSDGSVSLMVTTALPPDSSLWISLEYAPRFLSFEHYPSDPNRGVDVLPSYGDFRLISKTSEGAVCSSGNSFNRTLGDCFFGNEDAGSVRLYSPSAIVMPPVPDMSMPFNVVSLTCTLYAFIIGSMVNFLVRKSSQGVIDAYKGKEEQSKMAIMKEKLKRKMQALGFR